MLRNISYRIRTGLLPVKCLYIASLTLLAACSSNASQNAEEIPYRIISYGQYSGLSLEKNLVIQTSREFAELWTVHASGSSEKPPLIDFEQETLVAIYMGQKNTGGYAVGINTILLQDDHIVVKVQYIRPRPDQEVTMALTQPYVMFTIAKTSLPVTFELVTP